ncbi:MAG: hypothetical protein J6B51_09865 [Clostridia bacterium]|nr:hypothetical protein [Clostridia bacterium]
MDDMISRISELLSDPAQAEKIKQIAASLADSGGGDGGSSVNAFSDTSTAEKEFSDSRFSQSASTDMLSSLFSSSDSFSSDRMSRNITLLNAITPYLRPSRASKISSAIKAIQIIDILSKAR